MDELGDRVGADGLGGFGEAEGAREGEDGHALLGREDGAGRVGASVAQSLDRVEDWDLGVAEAEEVRVERVEALVCDA